MGYDILDRKLVINPEEAATVRHIFQRFAEVGSATDLTRELRENGYATKSRVCTTGKSYEGHPYNKGSLYKLLNNRVYIGEVVHQEHIYPGEHEAIIDVATWDKVHAIFAANGWERSGLTRRQSPAFLKGLVHCRKCRRAMTPSHTRKEGRLYRYYLCTGAAKNGHDSCDMPTIPAGDVELMVLDHLRAIIHAPEMAVRTWRSASEETAIKETEILESLRSLDTVWEQLFPAEQARLTQLLVARVEVASDGIGLHLRTEGLASLVQELRQPVNNDQPARKKA